MQRARGRPSGQRHCLGDVRTKQAPRHSRTEWKLAFGDDYVSAAVATVSRQCDASRLGGRPCRSASGAAVRACTQRSIHSLPTRCAVCICASRVPTPVTPSTVLNSTAPGQPFFLSQRQVSANPASFFLPRLRPACAGKSTTGRERRS